MRVSPCLSHTLPHYTTSSILPQTFLYTQTNMDAVNGNIDWHILAPLFSAKCWPADQVRGRRLTPAPPTPAPPTPPMFSCPTLGPLTTLLPPIPGESIQLDGWLQTGGLGAGMFLWHCRAQIPLSTGAQLNHSSLITVRAALAPAPTQHQVRPLSFCSHSHPYPRFTPQKVHTCTHFSQHTQTKMDFNAFVQVCVCATVNLPLSSPLYSTQFSNMSFTSATNSSFAM